MRVACIQINSNADPDRNLTKTQALVQEAAASGAQWVLTPENIALMPENGEDIRRHAAPADNHRLLTTFQEMAREHAIWLLVGSLPVLAGDPDNKVRNRSFLLNPKGQVTAWYDKMHLFNVTLPNGETYGESCNYAPGNPAPTLAEMPCGVIGLTICYDVRFPYLHRQLAQQSAFAITAPSAFTAYTGKAHWEVLLRARAIENGCYILAPAQTGKHPGNRETWGHTMIISPWGEILADAGTDEGIITADITQGAVDNVRHQIPSLTADVHCDFTKRGQ